MPEHKEENCECFGCVMEWKDEQKRIEAAARAEKQRLLLLERRYPMVVAGRVRRIPYTLAKRSSRYRQTCSCGRPAERSSWLCTACRDQIRYDLLDIEAAWPTLEQLLFPGSKNAGSEKIHSTMTGSPAPIDVAISDIMHQVRDSIWGVTNQMLQDHPGMVLPNHQSTGALAGWLGRWHVQYFATHPESSLPDMLVDELYDDISLIRTRVDPSGVRQLRVPGACRTLVTLDSGARRECGGELSAVLRPPGDRKGSWVRCSVDPEHDIRHSKWLGMLKAQQRKETQV